VRYAAGIPAAAILAGSALGLAVSEPPVLAASIALTASVVSAFWCHRDGGGRLLAAFVAASFFCGAVLLAATAWQHAWRPPLRAAFEEAARAARAHAEAEGRQMPLDDEATMVIEGILRADASPSEHGVSLSVDVDAVQADTAVRQFDRSTGVIVSVVGSIAAERAESWRAGRRVRMPADLHRPARYLNPGVPDGERALARRGTTLVGTVKSGALVEVLARGSRWTESLATARAFARTAIERNVGRWSPQSAAIVAAIVVGDRSALDPTVQRRLQEAGTYHVIAISGGNIAILAGLLLGGFRIAGVLGRGAMLSAIAVLLAYAQFVGGGASVDRATWMAVLYFGARALDQRSPPLNAVAVVAAVLVVANPLAVVDPAFLLTFGATVAILVVAPRLDISRLPAPLPMLAAMLVASAAAELLLLPIGARFFERVTFAGLALNFLAIPLMAVAQIAGMVLVPAAMISTHAAAAAGWIAHLGAAGLISSADLVRFAPVLTWRVAAPPLTVCAAYYAALAGCWHRSRWRMPAAAVASAAALWILIDPRTVMAARGDGRLHVTFLDVGQGDAIFIVFPRGSTLLIDAGGNSSGSAFDIGDRVVGPAIRGAGFRRVDRLVVTHGDADHIGGAASIVREFGPREVFEGIPVPRSEPLAQLRVASYEARAAWSTVYAHYRVAIDGVEVAAWHPNVEDWERQRVRNDDSLVLEIRWRDASILLTGDIGREVEQMLTPLIQPAPLRVVKIPHHGSLTSSTVAFVEALRPKVAVASAGRSNRFGHPVAEVLRRYEAVGASVYRTDRDGAVFVETDGAEMTVRTFASRMTKSWPRNHEITKGK
jgi:competence protein ComEC